MVVEGEEQGVKLINKSVDQQLNSLLGAKKRLDIRNLASLFNYQMFCLSINIPANSVTRTVFLARQEESDKMKNFVVMIFLLVPSRSIKCVMGLRGL